MFETTGKFVELCPHLPKNGNVEEDLLNHIRHERHKTFSPKFISCTKIFRWALYFCQRKAEKHDHKPLIVEIDVSKISPNINNRLFDVSNVDAQAKHCKGNVWKVIKKFDAEDVLSDAAIPQKTVVNIHDL